MKQGLNIVALILLILFVLFCIITKSYEPYKEEINQNINNTMAKNKQKVDNHVDISSQEFRDSLSIKMYGKQNYEDMQDPNIATRIYNSRMNMPSKKEREQRKKEILKKNKNKLK